MLVLCLLSFAICALSHMKLSDPSFAYFWCFPFLSCSQGLSQMYIIAPQLLNTFSLDERKIILGTYDRTLGFFFTSERLPVIYWTLVSPLPALTTPFSLSTQCLGFMLFSSMTHTNTFGLCASFATILSHLPIAFLFHLQQPSH